MTTDPLLCSVFWISDSLKLYPKPRTERINDGFVGIGFGFLTQTEYVDVDRAVGHRAVVAPDRIQQLLAAENDARTAHQELQQPKLGRGERKRLPVEPDAATAPVQFQSAGLQQARRRRLAAELNLDAGDQLADEERLDDVVVRAQFQARQCGRFPRRGPSEK